MDAVLKGRVAIVTGAGGGLGRAHAVALARAGARVMVNDLGGARDGTGGSSSAAEVVCAEILAAGGEAIPDAADVCDYDQVQGMIAAAREQWGGVDILVNNAGILRDRTFAKAELSDFRKVIDVHLMGAVHCTKALWDEMRERRHGRIIFTTSSSGLYGNFGQSSYGAAKMALVGLMNTLRLEGEKYGIHVNCLSPSAATRMTEDIMDETMLRLLDPANVAPAVVALASDDAPNGTILCAGAGSFERAYITLTRGVSLAPEQAGENILHQWDAISDRQGEMVPAQGPEQAAYEVSAARALAEPA